MSGTIKKFMFVNRKAPYGTIYAWESLEVVLSAAAFEQDVSMAFLDDGVYHTFSGIVFDHCTYPLKSFKEGELKVCAVFGPTCDAFDTISVAEYLPELEIGDLLYAENIGAYSIASSTYFNGFPPAKVVHINE